MDEVDPSLLATYQIKPWSIGYFFTQSLEGHALLLREIKYCLKRGWARLFRRGRRRDQTQVDKQRPKDHLSIFLASSSSSTSTSAAPGGQRPPLVNTGMFHANQEDDKQATSLKYGIITLSKLAHVIGLWIPSFTLDISLDLQISNFFVIFSYFQLVAFFAIGLVVVKWVLEPSLVQILDKIAPSVMQVFTMTVFFSEICYLSYGLLSCAYILYQRNFIQDFFLYRCTMITLPRCYQRRKIVTLLLALYVFAFTSEPLYALLSLYYDLQQPRVWPHLSRGWFYSAKWATIALTSLSASLLSSTAILIPLMTCFLMLASARHLKITMEKQLLRYRRVACCSQHQLGREGQSTSQLEALLDNRTRKIIDDYSCHTLTMDWPEMVDTRTKRSRLDPEAQTIPIRLTLSTSTSASTSASSSVALSSSTTATCCPSSRSSSSRVEPDRATALVPIADHASQQQLSASASGLLFLYKNLLKNMSEIKQMIRLWESKFTHFHLIYTLINCLIVTQWITVAFTEARGRNLSDTNESQGPTRAITLIGSYSISPFVVRIIGGVLTFIISNIYIMLWCDCLSRRLIKIKAQLFKMNIDLTNSHVLSIGPPLELCGDGATSSGMGKQDHNSAGGPVLGQYAEIEQIWSLYDQVDRLASTTLFKFSSDTYYTKRCLLVIFGRSVSVLLLFIQIVEMYSYA